MVPHDKIGEAMKRLLGRICMDGSERTGVAGVKRSEERSRLDSAYFAKDDPVRSPGESGLKEIVERDASFEGIRLAFNRQHVRLVDMKLCGIFDDDDAL